MNQNRCEGFSLSNEQMDRNNKTVVCDNVVGEVLFFQPSAVLNHLSGAKCSELEVLGIAKNFKSIKYEVRLPGLCTFARRRAGQDPSFERKCERPEWPVDFYRVFVQCFRVFQESRDLSNRTNC